METNVPPVIIPMWLTGTKYSTLAYHSLAHTCTGFDKLMPENRSFPSKFIPKMGIQLGVTFGDPIPTDKILKALNVLHRPDRSSLSPGVVENSIRHNGRPHRSELSTGSHVRGWMEGAIAQARGDFLPNHDGGTQMDEIRSEVTAIIQRAVEDLGRKVSGDTLDLPLHHRTGETGDRHVH